jgi:transcriptional regulator with XRE-family HTH domain
MTDFQSIESSYRDSVLLRSRVPINGIRTLAPMRKRERSPFGARLKLAREKAGLTQPELAQAVGMGQSTLAEAEGVGNSSSFTVRIAQRCGVSALWLESGDGDMLDSSTWPFTDELLAYVNSLSADGLVKLEGVMRAHLGMAPIPAESLHDLSTHAVTDPSPTLMSRPLLDRNPVGFLSTRSN